MRNLYLFPQAVSVFKMDRAFTEKELRTIESIDYKPNAFNRTSANVRILETEEFSDIRDWCQQSIDQYFDEHYKPMHSVGLEITESWVNVTLENERHHAHAHPNSLVSAVLYVQAASGDIIRFIDTSARTISIESREMTAANSATMEFEVEAGYLMVFPSTLWHEVPYKVGTDPRITLAFNSFPRGKLFGDDGLCYLEIR